MPHLTLQHTTDLPRELASPALFQDLHRILAEVGGISMGNCKARALALDRWYVGDGRSGQAFVHLEVRMLEGRAETLKRQLGEALLARLVDAYASDGAAVQVTVELVDMPRATYFKHPSGTLSEPAGAGA